MSCYPSILSAPRGGQCVRSRLFEGRDKQPRQIAPHWPRRWGGYWLALWLWDRLALDEFWQPLLAPSRKGTQWLNAPKTLTVYRLLDPGSGWRLHRLWFERGTMDLLGEDA